MPSYTFHSLSDADFEELCRDLLQASLQLRLQSFTKGRDGGIDLLNTSRDGDTVVQCKHYCRSDFSKLKSKIERGEVPKLKKLQPKRYILCTSIGLTPDNKKTLVEILKPYCRSTDDIFGCDDLNGLLRDYPKVETAHHKLWLTSTAVLRRILKNGAAVWNEMEEDEIAHKLALYVQTAAFDDAMEILSKFRYCIVSGIPGIGKTTLAQILVTRFVDDGYELVTAREDVREALDQLDSKRKQVIYFDDFLGRSSLGERLSKNEDEGILRLLKTASRAKNKRIILTTREYILTDAQQKYERLSGPELELAKCIVELAKYTRGNRARILYNHLYFSDVPKACINSLLSQQRYQKVIDHPNFSPRIIEWMTMGMGRANVAPSQFADEFVANLNNPNRIWEHAFESHLTPEARCLLHVLATMSQRVDFDDLEIAWNACLPSSDHLGAPGEIRLKYERTLKQLDGSFISTERVGSMIAVSFHNPSVKDFVRARIGVSSQLAGELLASARYFTQIEALMGLQKDGKHSVIATGLIGDSVALRTAIRRTIGVRSPSLRLDFSWKRFERGWFNHGERFSNIASWATDLCKPELLDDACQLLLELDNQGKVSITISFTEFMETLIQSNRRNSWHDDLIQKLVERIDRTLEDTDDWRTWGKFVIQHERSIDVGDRSELDSLVKKFCEIDAYVIVSSVGSSSDIESWASELEGVGSAWGIDISKTLEYMSNQANERRSEERPEPDGDKYERPSIRHDEVDSDDAIGRLFDSLRASHH
ncbi:MAG: restriction endonuclease [Planctomycetaceae bacterium]|nr:restriction endonuclease [Planctomycetaceae bacterium]